MSAQQGIPCPQCQFMIPVLMEMLLSAKPIGCPRCGLELTIDREQSKESLEAVRNVYEAMQNVEKTKRQWE